MKLLKARVQNYRVHRDLEARLDAPLSLIQGPNESGKSTLVEAIHRALFLNAKGTSESHKEMVSTSHDGTPTVELEFSSHGKCYTLRKEFAGTKGKTELSAEGEAPLTGEAAESKLAELLGVDGGLGGGAAKKGLPQRWAHLWVRQGSSELSPLSSDEVHSPLRRELQKHTGMGILVSQADAALIERLQSLVDESFTSGGKVKAGSKLKELEDALDQANSSLAGKQQQLAELENAARQYTQGKEESARHSETLQAADHALKQVVENLEKATLIAKQHDDASTKLGQSRSALTQLKQVDQDIRETSRRLEEAQQNLKPQQDQADATAKELATLRSQLSDAESSRVSLTTESRLASQKLDAWKTQQSILRSRSDLGQRQKALKTIASLQSDIQQKAREAAKIDAFDKACLANLQKLSREADSAQARLDAYALKVELLESNTPVSLDGTPLKDGEARTLAQTAELSIGGNKTRIRLTPGGHQNLDQARQCAGEAAAALAKAFDQLGITRLEQADEQHLRFQQLKQDLDRCKKDLASLDPDEVAGACDQLSVELERQQATLERLNEPLQLSFSDQPDAIRDALEEAEQACRKSDTALKAADAREGALRKKRDQLEADLAQATEALGSQKTEVTRLESRIKTLTEQAGDPTDRATKISTLELGVEQAEQELKKLQTRLDELGHTQLKSDHERLTATIENSKKLLREAENKMLVAGQSLRSEGSSDPQREVLEAQARCTEIAESLDRVRRQAEVRRELLDRLQSAQADKAQTLAKPLEEAAAPYLQAIFGSQTRARLQWSDDGTRLEGLAIDRTHHQAGLFDFEHLSHGAREQAALAIRLAMAEVLASAHDNCLPIVLDDAFTHADRSRVEKLKRVLYQGTQNGLQIILLTCHPENYSGLTPNEITLG